MRLLRLALLGVTGYGIYRYVTQPGPLAATARGDDGLAAVFRTREQADLAIEHLVQQHGVTRSAIFVEPVGDRNTSGSEISGGDAPSGDAEAKARDDAALNGAIRVTVPATGHDRGVLQQALDEAGAERVETY